MNFAKIIATILFILLFSLTGLYIIGLLPEKFIIEFITKLTAQIIPTTVQSTTTTLLTTTTTTTTTIPSTTTTTLPTNETIAWLERRVHELVNAKRTAYGLQNLTWDDLIDAVARKHSKDMAEYNYFSHTSLDGSNLTTRLHASGVYYWNNSAENILKTSKIKSYFVDDAGNIINTTYRTLEEIANRTVAGWMNSTHHRENILNANFTDAGVGVAAANDENSTYYFTQNFITRVTCGYKDGECCETEGYLPWCYTPWECVDGFCV